MANSVRFQIIAGPSREELFDALRLRHEGRKVTFTLVSADKISTLPLVLEVSVDEISSEDGSGESWILKLSNEKVIPGYSHYRGYFHSKDRRGSLSPERN